MEKLAYLRKEKETVEIDYSLTKIWKAIPKVLATLEWSIEAIDATAHHVKAKTEAGFMSYSSVLIIDAVAVDKKTARVTVSAETPVTTITSLAEFGRTQHRIALFFETLAKQLTSQKVLHTTRDPGTRRARKTIKPWNNKKKTKIDNLKK